MLSFIVLYSRKIFLMPLPLLFKKWMGVTQPLVFLSATVFDFNKPEHQLKAQLILPHGKILRIIFPLFWFTKFILLSIHSVLDRKKLHKACFNSCRWYIFQNMCIVTCDSSRKNKHIALLGIAVPVFSYQ